MFDSHYPVTFRFKEKNKDDSTITSHIYHFYCNKNQKYVIVVDEYPEGFFVIQFYLWKHKKNKNKYLIKAGSNSSNVKVISTCLHIMLVFLKKYPNASFAFQGILDPKEQDKPICVNQRKSQRYRIYEYMVSSRISSAVFHHATYEEENAYLLVNKRDKRENIVQIIENRYLSYLR